MPKPIQIRRELAPTGTIQFTLTEKESEQVYRRTLRRHLEKPAKQEAGHVLKEYGLLDANVLSQHFLSGKGEGTLHAAVKAMSKYYVKLFADDPHGGRDAWDGPIERFLEPAIQLDLARQIVDRYAESCAPSAKLFQLRAKLTEKETFFLNNAADKDSKEEAAQFLASSRTIRSLHKLCIFSVADHVTKQHLKRYEETPESMPEEDRGLIGKQLETIKKEIHGYMSLG